MATKAELEAREAECSSVIDICKLALEALEEPKDLEYAKELLSKAEVDCSMPNDYIAVAEVYAKMGNKDSAEEMYEEAEDACFEPMEIASLGHSIAINLGDKEKAKELLENAANDAKKINEILTISNYVLEDLQDEELAKNLMSKVEAQCKELKDYKELAKTIIKEQNDKELAKNFFLKAANKIDGIEQTVEFALSIIELFDDKDEAKSALEDVEDDAQFTKECVALARGYLKAGDEDKVKEMLENAKEYAMTGEEQIDLALGIWELLKDKDLASESFKAGVNDLNDKDKLFNYAKIIALEIGNIELAKKYYERAESKLNTVSDLSRLAQAIIDNLKDKDYARQVYERAEQSLEMPQDLMNLATDVIKNLDDRDKAKVIYEKAMSKIEKLDEYLKLFDEVIKNLKDNEFGKKILETAFSKAQNTPEMLKIVSKGLEVLNDKDFSAQVLEKAEEIVTNLSEMKEVKNTVKDKFSDNEHWVKRVEEKLEKREKNQDKYDAYQKREELSKTFKDLRLIVEDMMDELNDKYYAQKLLKKSEKILDGLQFNIDNYRKLIDSIVKYLQDFDWVEKIIRYLLENKVKFFFDYYGLAHLAKDVLTKGAKGTELANEILKTYEKNFVSKSGKCVYDYTDLAKSVFYILGDKDWSIQLLKKAEEQSPDSYAYAYLAYLAKIFGDVTLAKSYYDKSKSSLNSAATLQAIVERMKNLNVSDKEIKDFYSIGENLTSPEEQLIWAEGIVDLLNARDWAEKVYKKIERNFKSEDLKERFDISRKIHLEGKFW